MSFLYWGEGNKSGGHLAFTNSDPEMVQVFLKLLKQGFDIDDEKIRALLHLHEYHDEVKVKEFWSKTLKIPTTLFSKTYIKPHTAITKRENYLGCIRIRYYNSKIAKQVKELYNAVAKEIIAS